MKQKQNRHFKIYYSLFIFLLIATQFTLHHHYHSCYSVYFISLTELSFCLSYIIIRVATLFALDHNQSFHSVYLKSLSVICLESACSSFIKIFSSVDNNDTVHRKTSQGKIFMFASKTCRKGTLDATEIKKNK